MRAHWLILVGGVAVVAAIRGWLASRIAMPWLFSDELVHSELAKNLANGSLFEIRGRHVNITYAYPLVIAPAWLLSSMGATYAVAKAINVVLVSAAAVPVYLLGRRLASPAGAAVAAVLAVLVPDLALTGALMQENLAYPAFLTAALLIVLCLEEPTAGHQVALLAAIAVAAAARFELLVLVAIVPTAVLLARASARRLAGVFVPCVGVIVVLAVLDAVQPSRLQDALQTFPETSAGYGVGGVLRWIVRSLAELDLATGAIPLVALVLLTLPRATPRRPAERAFLSVAWASLGWFLVVGGLSGSWEPFGLKERYLFYVEPLLLLALVLWVELGPARRLRVVLGAAAVLALCVAFLPLGSLLTAPSLPGQRARAGGVPTDRQRDRLRRGLRALLVGAVLAVPLVAAALARRRVVALGFVGVFIAVSAAFAARIADDQARAVAATAMLPADRSWVDAAVGKDANVTLLNTSNFMPETVRQEIFPVFAPWWETQFWNRSAPIGRQPRLTGAVAARAGLGQARLGDAGSCRACQPASAVLVDPRFEVVGRRRAAPSALVLYDRVPVADPSRFGDRGRLPRRRELRLRGVRPLVVRPARRCDLDRAAG